MFENRLKIVLALMAGACLVYDQVLLGFCLDVFLIIKKVFLYFKSFDCLTNLPKPSSKCSS